MVRVLFIILWSLASSAWAGEHVHHKAPGAQESAGYAEFSKEMGASMKKMDHDMHAHGESGNVDEDFLLMMIPHHQGAIDMARLVLIYGRDPYTRSLAEEIISGQQVEIETMKRRLSLLRGQRDANEFPALGGTRGKSEE